MKPFTLKTAVALAVLSAVLLPTLASSSATLDNQTLHTIMRTTAYTTIDADHNGKPSVGDYSIARVVHIDPKTGRRVGTGVAICTQVATAASVFDCQGSDSLPGGELREAGKLTIGKTWHLSILGGSGRYDGASGSVDGTWLDAKATKSSVLFTIATN